MLLVGDSAANVVYGYDTTVPVTVDELIPLVRGVVRGAPHALVVADMPFGSYEAGPQQALATATRFLKETGAHAVKLEGGERVADQIATLIAGRHPGDGPHRFHPAERERPRRLPRAGPRRRRRADHPRRDRRCRRPARSPWCWRWCPRELATQITGELTIPTIGIGAGPNCDAQVLVWQDMAGLTSGKTAKFVKRFGDVGGELRRAATQYADEVASGAFPPKSTRSRRTRPSASPGTRRRPRGRRRIRRVRRSGAPSSSICSSRPLENVASSSALTPPLDPLAVEAICSAS